MRKIILSMLSIVIGLVLTASGAQAVKKMVFEEQKIEGKIRRPQLVLITAEQRPEFTPMVMQSLGKNSNITGSVNEEIIDDSPYKKSFQFEGTKIINYSP